MKATGEVMAIGSHKRSVKSCTFSELGIDSLELKSLKSVDGRNY